MYNISVVGIKRVRRWLQGFNTGTLVAQSFNESLAEYRTALIKQIKARTTLRYSTAKIRKSISTHRYTKAEQAAYLSVSYTPIPLAHYHTVQVKIGKKKVMKKVVPSSAGIRFKQGAGTGKPYTKVRVWRGSNLKLVKGKYGYKGFLQHKKFMIYERKQYATWRGIDVRAPYKPLYSMSISQLVRSKKIQTEELNERIGVKITKKIVKRMGEHK